MTADYNGWADMPEDEAEELGKLDEWEGWPEELSGPEYWLHKRDAESGEV